MRHWIHACCGTAALLASSLAADAADRAGVPPAAASVAYNWSGFHAGVNAGWGKITDNGSTLCRSPSGVAFGPGCVASVALGITSNGIFGGGQIGFNSQHGRLVWGVEADFQGSDINGSTSRPGPFPVLNGGLPAGTPANAWRADQNLDWFGTVRGRVGLAFDRTLIYATGGLAYGRINTVSTVDVTSVATNTYMANESHNRTGWTLGGGVEYAFADRWSLKGEGLYYDLGTASLEGPDITPPPSGYRIGKVFEANGWLLRGGLNYRFDYGRGSAVAKY